MASKKALAIKEAKKQEELSQRWERLELLVLAIAEKAGIDVDKILEDLSKPADKEFFAELEQPAAAESVEAEEEEKPKKRKS